MNENPENLSVRSIINPPHPSVFIHRILLDFYRHYTIGGQVEKVHRNYEGRPFCVYTCTSCGEKTEELRSSVHV